MTVSDPFPEFTGKVQRWGNSLALRITRGVSELAGLEEGTEVLIEVQPGAVLIRPRPRPPSDVEWPAEHELIAGLDARRAHADELPTPTSSEWGD